MCAHLAIDAHVTVDRVTPLDGGPGFDLYANIHARCRACGHPIIWAAPDGPTISPDGSELRSLAFVSPTKRHP